MFEIGVHIGEECLPIHDSGPCQAHDQDDNGRPFKEFPHAGRDSDVEVGVDFRLPGEHAAREVAHTRESLGTKVVDDVAAAAATAAADDELLVLVAHKLADAGRHRAHRDVLLGDMVHVPFMGFADIHHAGGSALIHSFLQFVDRNIAHIKDDFAAKIAFA